MEYQEQIASGPALIRIQVQTAEPIEWVLDDTTFLDYRLGKVERSHAITSDKIDLLWDREVAQKTVHFRADQLLLTGNWLFSTGGFLNRWTTTAIPRTHR